MVPRAVARTPGEVMRTFCPVFTSVRKRAYTETLTHTVEMSATTKTSASSRTNSPSVMCFSITVPATIDTTS